MRKCSTLRVMKPEKFVNEIIENYHKARVAQYPDKKIHRGRSISISSVSEDLLASFLLKNDKTIGAIYVDQPIHVPDVVKIFIPDVVIVRGSTITAFLDLKMDLGYKRYGLVDLCRKDQELLKKVRGKECSLTDGHTKEKHRFTVSKEAIYDIVVISSGNIGKKILESQLNESNQFNKDVAVHVLTDGYHPNTYGLTLKELMKHIEINEDSFRNILSRI